MNIPYLESSYVIIAVIVGAFGRRFAGGLLTQWLGFDIGTQFQRLVWGATAGATVFAVGQPWFVAVGTIVCVWLGSCLFGYGAPWDNNPRGLLMGRTAGNPLGPVSVSLFWQDFFWMTYHGLGGVMFLALGAWYLNLGWPFLVTAGALCAPCYALAYAWMPNVPWLGLLNEPDKGLVDPPPTGEMLWGGLIGASLVLAIMGI